MSRISEIKKRRAQLQLEAFNKAAKLYIHRLHHPAPENIRGDKNLSARGRKKRYG